MAILDRFSPEEREKIISTASEVIKKWDWWKRGGAATKGMRVTIVNSTCREFLTILGRDIPKDPKRMRLNAIMAAEDIVRESL